MGYYIDPFNAFSLYVEMDGSRIPETLRGIEAAWNQVMDHAPFGGQF